MKIAMFTTKEAFVEWHQREIEAIRKNGLKFAKEQYEKALRGEGKEAWLKWNNASIDSEGADEMWAHYLDYLKGDVAYLERKIKKYERAIAKCIAE